MRINKRIRKPLLKWERVERVLILMFLKYQEARLDAIISFDFPISPLALELHIKIGNY
jgi:hypothetical protein